MARARNIKPGFFANEDLVELSFEYRLLFIGLWTLADRDGRLEDRPKRIKMAVFPADTVDVEDGLRELTKAGFIKRYEANGVSVVQILSFTKHQNPHHTEKASELPDENGIFSVKAPAKKEANGDLTVKEQEQDGGYLADSLNPDSLNPDSPKEEKRKRSTSPAKPESVSESTWQDFLALRKGKKALVTETAMAAMQREADKAGVTLEVALQVCCETGWQAFNASFYANRMASQPRNAAPTETAYQRSQRLRVAEACPDLARPAPNETDFFRTAKPMGNVVEVEVREVERIAR